MENDNCSLCRAYENAERLGEYIRFHVALLEGRPTAIWYMHETEQEIIKKKKICPCKILTMENTLSVKARKYYGHSKIRIDKINDTGHLHMVAVSLK